MYYILDNLDNHNDNDNGNENENDINLKSSIDDFLPQKKNGVFFSDNNDNNKTDFVINKNQKKSFKYQNKFNTRLKNYNQKKILCNNYIVNDNCAYGNKCLYAHNISEQNIDSTRQKVLDIINSSDDLSKLDLNNSNNKFLLRDLLIYTRVCENCKKNKCTGGYNCKFGACSDDHVICYDNLNYDNCKNKNCNFIHLTKRGLKPIYSKIYYTINNIDFINKNNKINNNIFSQNYLLNCINDILNIDDINNINKLFLNENYNNIDTDDDNDDNDDECLKSIFDTY